MTRSVVFDVLGNTSFQGGNRPSRSLATKVSPRARTWNFPSGVNPRVRVAFSIVSRIAARALSDRLGTAGARGRSSPPTVVVGGAMSPVPVAFSNAWTRHRPSVAIQ